MSDHLTRDDFVAFVRRARRGVLATVDPAGHPEAALLGLAVDDDATLLLDCPTTSRKMTNLAANPRVALVIGWADDVSIQVEGVAEVLTGARRRPAAEVYLGQFPGARVLDEAFALVRVTPRWLRYYDARPRPAVVFEQTCW